MRTESSASNIRCFCHRGSMVSNADSLWISAHWLFTWASCLCSPVSCKRLGTLWCTHKKMDLDWTRCILDFKNKKIKKSWLPVNLIDEMKNWSGALTDWSFLWGLTRPPAAWLHICWRECEPSLRITRIILHCVVWIYWRLMNKY